MGYKILIVDDEPLVRRALARAFERAGQGPITEAADGPQGLELWRKELPDIVMIDVIMPGWSGPDLIREALKDGLKAKAIALMSAYTGPLVAGERSPIADLPSGTDIFIPKPFQDIIGITQNLIQLAQKNAANETL